MAISLPPDAPTPRPNRKLLDGLVAAGYLTREQAETAASFGQRNHLHSEEALLVSGFVDEPQLLKFQAKLYQTRFVSTDQLANASIDRRLLRWVPAKLANMLTIFPVVYDPGSKQLSVLTVEPDDPEVIKHIRFATRLQSIQTLVARPSAIRAAIKTHYEGQPQSFSRVQGSHEASPPAADGELVTFSRHQDRAGQAATGVSIPAPAPREGAQFVHAGGGAADQAVPAGEGGQPEAASELTSVVAPDATDHVSVQDYIEMLQVLVGLLDNRRDGFSGHSIVVTKLCRRVCERLGLSASETDAIAIAALLHDIGKTSGYHLAPVSVAANEGHRLQAQRSYLTPLRLFEAAHLPQTAIKTLREMYERYDGLGFPERLTGKEISLGARLLAIVETYVDLTANPCNVHGQKLPPERAAQALCDHKGTLFDPDLVDLFKAAVLGDDVRTRMLSSGRRALLVDPDPEETAVLELKLIERSFDVHSVRSPQDALQDLQKMQFDVVISEVNLAPLDGFAFLQQVREARPELPFVFLSAATDSELMQQGFKLGCDDYITKPVSPNLVALKIDRVLQERDTKRRSAGVSGSLAEMSLPDVVQVLHHGRKTGRLSIRSEGKQGSIEFAQGHIFDAAFGDLAAEEAFYAMLRLAEGTFELDPSARPQTRVIQLSPESLLLEGMRRLDELGARPK